jgi:hypothetical protein
MLGAMRRHSKSFLVYLLFAMIIIVFVFTFNTSGGGGGGCTAPEDPVYARVGNHDVTADGLVMAMQLLPTYLGRPGGMTFALAAGIDPSQLFRQDIEELTPEQADGLMKLVEAIYLASDEALRLGFSINDKELAESLYPASFYEEEEVTGEDGLPTTKKVFNEKDFQRWVKYGLNSSPQNYEKFTVAILLAFKLQNFMNGVVKVEPVEAELSARVRGTKVALSYVEFRPDFFEKLASVEEEEVAKFLATKEDLVKAYYDSHPADYHSSASYMVAGIYAAGKAPAPKAKPDAEVVLPTPEEMAVAKARMDDIRARLDGKKDLFEGGTLPIPEGVAPDAAIVAIPEDKLEQFKEVAKRESDHKQTKERSGLFMGWKTVAEMSLDPFGPIVAEALGGAAKDSVVGPVETATGYWVLFVRDVQPAKDVSYDDAKLEIAGNLVKQEAAPRAVKEQAEKFLKAVTESEEKDIAATIEAFKEGLKEKVGDDDLSVLLLQERKTGKFHLATPGSAIPGIGPYEELFDAAFTLPLGGGLDKVWVHPETNRAFVVKVVEKENSPEKIEAEELSMERDSLMLTRQIPYLEAWLKSLRQSALEKGEIERTEDFNAYLAYLLTRQQEAEEAAAKKALKDAKKLGATPVEINL